MVHRGLRPCASTGFPAGPTPSRPHRLVALSVNKKPCPVRHAARALLPGSGPILRSSRPRRATASDRCSELGERLGVVVQVAFAFLVRCEARADAAEGVRGGEGSADPSVGTSTVGEGDRPGRAGIRMSRLCALYRRSGVVGRLVESCLVDFQRPILQHGARQAGYLESFRTFFSWLQRLLTRPQKLASRFPSSPSAAWVLGSEAIPEHRLA